MIKGSEHSGDPLQVFGRTPDGKMGYLDGMTSERVDAGGVANIAQLAQRLPKQPSQAVQVLPMGSADDLKVSTALLHSLQMMMNQEMPALLRLCQVPVVFPAREQVAVLDKSFKPGCDSSCCAILQVWRQLDDTIMGGQSSSRLEASEGGIAVWTGDLIVVRTHSCGIFRHSLRSHHAAICAASSPHCSILVACCMHRRAAASAGSALRAGTWIWAGTTASACVCAATARPTSSTSKRCVRARDRRLSECAAQESLVRPPVIVVEMSTCTACNTAIWRCLGRAGEPAGEHIPGAV